MLAPRVVHVAENPPRANALLTNTASHVRGAEDIDTQPGGGIREDHSPPHITSQMANIQLYH